MNLTVQSQPTDDSGTAVIEVVGSIDVASRSRLADAARTALDAGASTIVLDLAGVSFIDSTGIGTLVDAAGGRVRGRRLAARARPVPSGRAHPRGRRARRAVGRARPRRRLTQAHRTIR